SAQQDNGGLAFPDCGVDRVSIGRPGNSPGDERRLAIEIGNAAHWSSCGWLPPDVRGWSIGEQSRQPLAVRREHGLHQQPARQARSRNTSQLLRRAALGTSYHDLHVRQPVQRRQTYYEEKLSSRINRRFLSVLAHDLVGTARGRCFLYAKSVLAGRRKIQPSTTRRPAAPPAAIRYFVSIASIGIHQP